MIAKRGEFYQEICKRNPSQKKFEKGWQNRNDKLSTYVNKNPLEKE